MYFNLKAVFEPGPCLADRGLLKAACAAIIAAWLGLAVVFPGVFVAAAHDHDHTGAECVICLEIQIALRILEGTGRAGAAALPVGLAQYPAGAVKPRRFLFVKKPGALKVKLNC